MSPRQRTDCPRQRRRDHAAERVLATWSFILRAWHPAAETRFFTPSGTGDTGRSASAVLPRWSTEASLSRTRRDNLHLHLRTLPAWVPSWALAFVGRIDTSSDRAVSVDEIAKGPPHRLESPQPQTVKA